MKKILLIAILLTSFGIGESNAQFFKKLTERAIQKTGQRVIERTTDKVANKVADKAVDATGDAMDKILNQDFGKFTNPMGKKVDMSKLPASYNFDYRYALKMTTKEGDVEFDYYLNKTKPYMGAKMNKGADMMLVFDEANKAIYTNVNGMSMAMEMDLTDALDAEDKNQYNDYTFKEIPNREFLGRSCIGREMENDEYKFTIYIAPNMEAGFANMFKSQHANIPPAMQKFTKEYENGLMMYMKMVDKKNNKKKNTTATMECVAFEPTNLVINTR